MSSQISDATHNVSVKIWWKDVEVAGFQVAQLRHGWPAFSIDIFDQSFGELVEGELTCGTHHSGSLRYKRRKNNRKSTIEFDEYPSYTVPFIGGFPSCHVFLYFFGHLSHDRILQVVPPFFKITAEKTSRWPHGFRSLARCHVTNGLGHGDKGTTGWPYANGS